MNQTEVSSKRFNLRSRLLPEPLPAFLAGLRKTARPVITSDSVAIRVTEKPPTPVILETAVEDICHQPAGAPLVSSADSSDTEATASVLVRKYEIGSGENKVNVRIYREPPANDL